MSTSLPTCEPRVAVAGDTWEWTKRIAAYPASEGYVLSYSLVPRGSATAEPLQWDAGWVTTDGDVWTVSIPAATTAALTAGSYSWQAHVTLATKRFTPERGLLTVLADFAEVEAGGAVEQLEIQLLAVRAELAARVTGTGSGYEHYQIGPRALGLIPLKELRDYEAALAARVTRLRRTGTFGTTILERYRRGAGYVSDSCESP